MSEDCFAALLTAGSFLAMVVTGTIALADAFDGSLSWAYEFVLAIACGASFVTLLPSSDGL